MKSTLSRVTVSPRTRIALHSTVNTLALLLALVALAPVSIAADLQKSAPAASVFCDGIRLEDEILVVNSRRVCGSCNDESLRKGLVVERYAVRDEAGHRTWQSASLDEFLAADPTVPTVIFVHGNQVAAGEAKCQGLGVYRCMMRHGANSGPMRFVIFSWPAEKVGFILRDVRVKAARTAPAGCQLGWLLDQMPAETPVSLVGFSFGARIITGGLHVLAGGGLNGQELKERLHAGRVPVNTVLIAAATDADWLGKGHRHGKALSQVDRMHFVTNCQDVAMKYYHLSVKGYRPQAMGSRGPTCLTSEQRTKVEVRDVSRYAGSDHDLFRYINTPGVAAEIWEAASQAPTGDVQVAQK